MNPIREYYEQHAPLVFRRCRKILGSREIAADAMQDVFVELLRFQERQTIDPEKVGGLLMVMSNRVCLRYLRTQKRRPEELQDPQGELLSRVACVLPEIESQSMIRSALQKLLGQEPETTWRIAIHFFVDRMTWPEVAAEVGMSVSGVRKRMRTLQARIPEMKGVAIDA